VCSGDGIDGPGARGRAANWRRGPSCKVRFAVVIRDDTYWGMIGRSRAGGLLARLLRRGGDEARERQLGALPAELGRMAAEESTAFKIRLEEQMDRANPWELWGAAYVVCAGCSDDGFESFRAQLIAQGRACSRGRSRTRRA